MFYENFLHHYNVVDVLPVVLKTKQLDADEASGDAS